MLEKHYLSNCVFCEDPPCTKACGNFDCGKILRSIKFSNAVGALIHLPYSEICTNCDKRCDTACISGGNVPVSFIMMNMAKAKKQY